jgi:hypothetical protein
MLTKSFRTRSVIANDGRRGIKRLDAMARSFAIQSGADEMSQQNGANIERFPESGADAGKDL